MSNEIIKVLDSLGEKLGIAIDWTAENVQPYLKDLMERFIDYKMIINIIGVVISLLIILLLVVIFKHTVIKSYKRCKENERSTEIWWYSNDGISIDGEVVFMIIAISMFTLLPSLIALFINTTGIIENIYLPEKALIEYITNMGA